MQIHSSLPAGVLLTNGLGADASSGALITAAKWHLFGCDATIQIKPTSTGGGSRPFAPGEIQNFYKPVTLSSDTKSFDYINVNDKTKNIIIVKFKMNDITNEKEFVLKPKPYKLAINIIKIINNTSKKASILVHNIINKVHNIKITIKRIKLKRD